MLSGLSFVVDTLDRGNAFPDTILVRDNIQHDTRWFDVRYTIREIDIDINHDDESSYISGCQDTVTVTCSLKTATSPGLKYKVAKRTANAIKWFPDEQTVR